MLLKVCRRCGNMITYPKTYCDACLEAVVQERAEDKLLAHRRYNKTRDKKYTQFYNSLPWRTLSQTYIQERQYKCEGCGKVASEVHHKEPIQTDGGWVRRLDWDNLEAVCLDCHNERHGRFQKKKKHR